MVHALIASPSSGASNTGNAAAAGNGHSLLQAQIPALREGAAGWLTPDQPTIIAAAPGRLDVMGGIADYSGATVLEATIGDLAVVALQRRDDTQLRVRTTGHQVSRFDQTEFSLDLTAFYVSGVNATGPLKGYDDVTRLFPPEARWAAYALGVFYVLLAEGEVRSFPSGADILVRSTVPLGAGVASSAALEVATMRAVAAAFEAPTSGMRLASLCQIVENRVVGAPCGIMDQVTCTLGREGQLLALRCQPHDLLGFQPAPAGYAFLGLDSGVKHAVGGQRYPRARCAAFMGRRIIRDFLNSSGRDPDSVRYLANLSPAAFRREFRHLLPASISGREFVDRWGETGDVATSVHPEITYRVLGATEHPIYENDRVRRFAAALQRAGDSGATADSAGALAAMRAAGRLMYGSHRSYSRNCGLGSKETDLLVSLVRRGGPESGLLGAKITGGGSGGTVAVLTQAMGLAEPAPRAQEALAWVEAEFERVTGWRPRRVSGSAPGAKQIEPVTFRWNVD